MLPVVIKDRVESMGDCYDGALVELRPNRLLNEIVRLEIDGRRRLVQD